MGLLRYASNLCFGEEYRIQGVCIPRNAEIGPLVSKVGRVELTNLFERIDAADTSIGYEPSIQGLNKIGYAKLTSESVQMVKNLGWKIDRA